MSHQFRSNKLVDKFRAPLLLLSFFSALLVTSEVVFGQSYSPNALSLVTDSAFFESSDGFFVG